MLNKFKMICSISIAFARNTNQKFIKKIAFVFVCECEWLSSRIQSTISEYVYERTTAQTAGNTFTMKQPIKLSGFAFLINQLFNNLF